MAASKDRKLSSTTATVESAGTAGQASPRKSGAPQPKPAKVMAAEAKQPEVKTAGPAPEPAPTDSEKTDFEKTQERYGAAYAILADGLKGEGVDKTVKIVQYGLAAVAVFVILAAIYSSF